MLTRTRLRDDLAFALNIPKAKAGEAVDAVLQAIAAELAGGGTVQLTGFGSFAAVERPSREGRNPRTGETLAIAGRRACRFRPGRGLREQLNRGGQRRSG